MPRMPRLKVDLMRKIGPVRPDGRWPWSTLDGRAVIAAGDARSRAQAERRSQRAAARYVAACRAMGAQREKERKAEDGYTLEVWV